MTILERVDEVIEVMCERIKKDARTECSDLLANEIKALAELMSAREKVID